MTELTPGIYERLITEGLRAQLDELANKMPVVARPLNSADASDRIAWHVSQQVERALLDRLGELVDVDVDVDQQARLADPASVQHAILRRNPDGTPAAIAGPLIPLLDTTLLTNAPGKPTLWSQLRSEIESADAIDVIAKFGAVFDSYWEAGDFVPYSPEQFDIERERAGRTDSGPIVILSPIELRPHPFQERLLELLELSRQRGHHRNLLVAATGTGKTVMAALDYATLTGRLGRSRLLFIAHREEILDQSLATFRYALRDASFGEKWVGGARPDHFDVVIVDEFHHASATSYRRILDHLQPVELRLWEAIDQQHLSPFLYFGVHDGLDLRDIPWRRGRGYDVDALSNAYTSSDAWARLVVKEVADHTDPASIGALGFCVSVEHAQFMAHHFNHHGIPSVAVWGDSPRVDREAALRDLAQGRVSVVLSVDLFNEGVDVPAVDTELTLRPTESPTLFLQQLGPRSRFEPVRSFAVRPVGVVVMLPLAKLGRGSEGYYLDTVAKGAEDYYVGRGEAPGYWAGRGAELLGLLTERLGVQWRPARNGIAEIDGAPVAMLRHFSKQRSQIEDRLAIKGYSSGRAVQVAALSTRDRKTDPESDQTLRERLRLEAESIGFNPATLDRRRDHRRGRASHHATVRRPGGGRPRRRLAWQRGHRAALRPADRDRHAPLLDA